MKNTFKFLVGAVAALALTLVMATGVSAAYTHSSLLKMGSKGSQVMSLQQTLNGGGFLVSTTGAGSPGMESSYFGSKTKAAVMAFQSAKGLTADGIVGMNTGTALAAMTGGSVSYPVGCSSTSGYSTVNGQPCTSTSNTSLPAGCSSTSGYSPTTGTKCDSSTSGSTNNGALSGGAGSVSAVTTSTDVNNYLVEGQSDVKVLGFKVTATDSDVNVSNLKVTLTKSGSSGSSSYLDRYVGNVSVWMNGSKVATVSASDFSRDSSGVYSKSISLSNAVVRMGSSDKATFYVTISGISNIDSNDMAATWTVLANDFRFQDSTGAILSYLSGDTTTLKNLLSVEDINSTGDVKLVISKASSSPLAGNVKVSDSASTSDILLLAFNAKNTGADMTFDSMSIDVTSTTNPVAMIGELTLKANGSSIATWTPTSTSTSLQHALFDLDDTYTIHADDTTVFTVVAKINDIDNFVAGAVTASYNSSTRFEVASTRTELVEEGAASGAAQTFFANGIVSSAFSYGTPVVQSNTSGTTTSATYAISFKVKASGATYFVPKAGTALVAIANGGTTATFAELNADGATLDGTSWAIADGSTATFTTTGVISAAASGFAKIPLSTLTYGTTNSGTGSTYTFSPASSYETSSTYFTD